MILITTSVYLISNKVFIVSLNVPETHVHSSILEIPRNRVTYHADLSCEVKISQVSCIVKHARTGSRNRLSVQLNAKKEHVLSFLQDPMKNGS